MPKQSVRCSTVLIRHSCPSAVGERERIICEIEKKGHHFREAGKCQGLFDASVDQRLLGVVRDVNGPLFDWVWERLGSCELPAHDCLRHGSPLVGLLRARGKGKPIEPTNLGDVSSLWNSCLDANQELINNSPKDDVLAPELHELAVQDAELERMTPTSNQRV